MGSTGQKRKRKETRGSFHKTGIIPLTLVLLPPGPGFKFWAPAAYLLVILGSQFTSLGLVVPICTMERRPGILGAAMEVKGRCERGALGN